MSAVEILRCQATAQVAFSADQRRCLVPFDQEHSGKLGERFHFADALMQQTGDQILWQYRKGFCKLSDTRKIAIDTAGGYELELRATVEGPTPDAIDVLRELWAALGELATEEPIEIDESIGTFGYYTTAIVRLPKTYRELFPALDFMARFTREHIGAPPAGPQGVETFHAQTRMSFAIGANQVERATVIEPRRTSKADDRIFFTYSPLRSDQHLAMLAALCNMG